MAEEPQFCYACYGTNVQVVDGALVCQDCGTQAQAQLEESEFQEVGGQGTGRLRRIRAPVQRRLRIEDAAITPEEVSQRLQQQATAYLHCLQALLQEQCKALPTLLGVAPEVCTLIRNLWFMLLPHTRLLDTIHLHTPNSETEPVGPASQSQDDGTAGLPSTSTAKAKAAGSGSRKGGGSTRYIFNIAGTKLKHGSLAGQRGQWAAELDAGTSDEEGGGEGDAQGGVGPGQQGEEEGEGDVGANSGGVRGMQDGSQQRLPSQGPVEEGQGDGTGGGAGGGAGAGEGGDMDVDDDKDLDFSGVDSEQRADDRLVRTGQHPWMVAKLFAAELSPNITLSLCFLACVATKQAVFPHDVIRLALDGRLPYLHPPTKCITYLDTLPYAVAAPVRLLMAPDGCGAVSELLVSAVEIAALLHIELPTINAPVLLYRAVTDLVLPEEVWMAAHELYSLFLHDTPLMTLSATTATHSPYTLLLTVVAMAVRVCYGLDGNFKGQPRFPSLPPPPTMPAETAHVTAIAGTTAATTVAGTDAATATAADATVTAETASRGGTEARQQGGDSAHQQAAATATTATGIPVTFKDNVTAELPNHVPLLQAFLKSAEAKSLPNVQQAALRAAVAVQAKLQEERVQGARHMAVSGWPAWSRARIQEWGNQQSYPVSSSEAAALSDEQLLDYLQFLRLHIAGEHAVPLGLQDLDTYLQQLGPAALRAPQSSQTDTAGAGLNQTGTTSAAAAGADVHQNQARAGAGLRQNQEIATVGTAAGPAVEMAQHAATSHDHVAPLKAGPSKAGPAHIAPSQAGPQTVPGVSEPGVEPSQAGLQLPDMTMPLSQAGAEDMPLMATQQWGFTQATAFQFGAADVQAGTQPAGTDDAAAAAGAGTGVGAAAPASAAGLGMGHQGVLGTEPGQLRPAVDAGDVSQPGGLSTGEEGPAAIGSVGQGDQDHGGAGHDASQLPGLNDSNGGATDDAGERGGMEPLPGGRLHMYERIQQPIADARYHADLMAVVCACSAYANVQPRVMLRLLALFEKYMCKAEQEAEKSDRKEKKDGREVPAGMEQGEDHGHESDSSGGVSEGGGDVNHKPDAKRRTRTAHKPAPGTRSNSRRRNAKAYAEPSASSESEASSSEEEGEGSEELAGQGSMEDD